MGWQYKIKMNMHGVNYDDVMVCTCFISWSIATVTVFMITYTTKYARWIQDSVAMFQCFSKEIENSRFLFSMYAFYENTY